MMRFMRWLVICVPGGNAFGKIGHCIVSYAEAEVKLRFTLCTVTHDFKLLQDRKSVV